LHNAAKVFGIYFILISFPFFVLVGTSLSAYSYCKPFTLISMSSMSIFSSNNSFVNVMRLLGYWWPQVDFIPPLASVAELWNLSTFVIPIMIFSVFLARNNSMRKPIACYGIALLIGVLLSTGMNAPGIVLVPIIVRLAEVLPSWILPLYSGVFRVPDYHVALIASSYDLLVAILVGHISKILFARARKKLWIFTKKVLVSMSLCSMLLVSSFAHWQFFSGSLYPSAYLNPSSQVKNPVGVFWPRQPSSDVSETYSWILNNNEQFNVLWIPLSNGFAYTWNQKASPPNEIVTSPKPVVGLDLLATAIKTNSSEDIALMLKLLGVKYIIILDQVEKNALQAFFGVNSIDGIVRYLQSKPGIRLISNSANVWVFEVIGAEHFYMSKNAVIAIPKVRQNLVLEALAKLGESNPISVAIPSEEGFIGLDHIALVIDETSFPTDIDTNTTWLSKGWNPASQLDRNCEEWPAEKTIILIQPAMRGSHTNLQIIQNPQSIHGVALRTQNATIEGQFATVLKVYREGNYSPLLRVGGSGEVNMSLWSANELETKETTAQYRQLFVVNNSRFASVRLPQLTLQSGIYKIELTLKGNISFDLFALYGRADYALINDIDFRLEWRQISPVLYSAQFQGESSSFLVFAEPWDPNWIAIGENGEVYHSLQVQDSLNGFILPKGGHYLVRYALYNIAAFGLLSAVSILFFLLLGVYFSKKKFSIFQDSVRIFLLFIFLFLVINLLTAKSEQQSWILAAILVVAFIYTIIPNIKGNNNVKRLFSILANGVLLFTFGYVIKLWLTTTTGVVAPIVAWAICVLSPHLGSILKHGLVVEEEATKFKQARFRACARNHGDNTHQTTKRCNKLGNNA